MHAINPSITQEDIATLAYRLWEETGRPGDRDQEFWFAAEQQLNAGRGGAVSPATTGKKSAQRRASRKRRD